MIEMPVTVAWQSGTTPVYITSYNWATIPASGQRTGRTFWIRNSGGTNSAMSDTKFSARSGGKWAGTIVSWGPSGSQNVNRGSGVRIRCPTNYSGTTMRAFGSGVTLYVGSGTLGSISSGTRNLSANARARLVVDMWVPAGTAGGTYTASYRVDYNFV